MKKIFKIRDSHYKILIFILISTWAVLLFYKFFVLKYTLTMLIPQNTYKVKIATNFSAKNSIINISHFIPNNIVGQDIENINISGNFYKYKIKKIGDNSNILFNFSPDIVEGYTNYSFTYIPKDIKYKIPRNSSINSLNYKNMDKYLQNEPLIEVSDSTIINRIVKLNLKEQTDIYTIIKRVFDYTYGLGKTKYAGKTSAKLTEQLQEASCNGKSRLMVALLRNRGIASRVVGGIIMQGRQKKTSHQWVEVYLGGYWIPFCPLNGYFAYKPAKYLKLYNGDLPLITHTKDINFNYSFFIKKMLRPRKIDNIDTRFNISSLWETFSRAGIPLNILKLILVIPIGAIVTIIFRNCFGVPTFGTFLPALIAASMTGTGLLFGILIFTSIIIIGTLINTIFTKLSLLHTPKLTIVMVFVVIMMITYAKIGITFSKYQLAQSILFPLAILTITIERFFLYSINDGFKKASIVLFWSMVVVAFSFMVISSVFLQNFIVIFPETYLLVIAISLYIGKWTGIRLSEIIRFKNIIFGDNK